MRIVLRSTPRRQKSSETLEWQAGKCFCMGFVGLRLLSMLLVAVKVSPAEANVGCYKFMNESRSTALITFRGETGTSLTIPPGASGTECYNLGTSAIASLDLGHWYKGQTTAYPAPTSMTVIAALTVGDAAAAKPSGTYFIVDRASLISAFPHVNGTQLHPPTSQVDSCGSGFPRNTNSGFVKAWAKPLHAATT